MYVILGYINIYKSGFFHRCGKPTAFDRHAGDIYATEAEAKADIHPPSAYIATCPVVWTDDEPVQPNPLDSKPIALSVTRIQFTITQEK